MVCSGWLLFKVCDLECAELAIQHDTRCMAKNEALQMVHDTKLQNCQHNSEAQFEVCQSNRKDQITNMEAYNLE